MESNRTLAIRTSSRKMTALASSMTAIHLAPRDCSNSVDIPSVLASSPLFSLSVCSPSSVIPTQAARAPFSNISSTLVPPNNSTQWLGLRAGEPANVHEGIPNANRAPPANIPFIKLRRSISMGWALLTCRLQFSPHTRPVFPMFCHQFLIPERPAWPRFLVAQPFGCKQDQDSDPE